MPLCGKKKLKVDASPVSEVFIQKMKDMFSDFMDVLHDRVSSNSMLTKTCYGEIIRGWRDSMVHITKSIDGKYIHIDYVTRTDTSHFKHTLDDIKKVMEI